MKATGKRDYKKKVTVYSEQEGFQTGKHPGVNVVLYQGAGRTASLENDLHSHAYYEVIWVERGSGSHTIDFIKYHFKGPCLFLLHPRNIHCIGDSMPTLGGSIRFSETFFFRLPELSNFLFDYNIFDDVNVRPVINLTKDQARDIKGIFHETVKTFRSTSRISKEILPHYVKIFLLKVYECKIGEANCNHQRSLARDRFNAFRALLEKHHREKHDVAFYLDALSVSEKTLRGITSMLAGKAPSTIIQERLVLEARRLLFHTTLSVKEIADQLGFQDASYFARLFQKHAGISPSQFRSNPEV